MQIPKYVLYIEPVHLLDIDIQDYKKFVNDQISYQLELDQIKRVILEQPTYTPGV